MQMRIHEHPGSLYKHLVDIGHKTTAVAQLGSTALEILAAGSVVDAVLTDVRMRAMSGPEFARRVLEQHPGLPIAFVTGYPQDVPDTADLRGIPCLAKPYDPMQLGRLIAELRELGATVRAFDPTACGELAPHQQVALDGIELTVELIQVADDADVIVVFTEWPEFAKVDLDDVAGRVRPGTTLVDMRNLFDPAEVKAAGLRYDGVGRR